MSEQWVDVAFVVGEDYDEIADFGTQEMAEYLSQWDYGQETDDAHTYVPDPRAINQSPRPWGSSDRQYEVSVGGLDYILAVNHPMGYASLNRHPLS